MSYDGQAAARASVSIRNNPLHPAAAPAGERRVVAGQVKEAGAARNGEQNGNGHWPTSGDGKPDFDKMDGAQRRAYHLARLNQKFG